MHIHQGTNLWKNGKKDECGDLYLKTCSDLSAKVRSKELKSPLDQAISAVNNVPKSKAAVSLRKALDKFMEDKVKVFYLNVYKHGSYVIHIASS